MNAPDTRPGDVCALCYELTVSRRAVEENPSFRPFCSACGSYLPVPFAVSGTPAEAENEPWRQRASRHAAEP